MATADAVPILRQTPLVTALHTRIRDQNASRHTVRRPRRPRPRRRPSPVPALQFVTQSDRLVRLLVEEAVSLLPATPKRVETPCGVYEGCALPSEDELCAVSIMRAADCMVSACRSVIPDVPIGKILIQRDEATALPKGRLPLSLLELFPITPILFEYQVPRMLYPSDRHKTNTGQRCRPLAQLHTST